MRDLSKAVKMQERYEQLMEEAADDERIFAGKLSDATRRRRHWEKAIAEIMADNGRAEDERRTNISKFIDENELYTGELWWMERDAFEGWK